MNRARMWAIVRRLGARYPDAPALVCERWGGPAEALAEFLGCEVETALRLGLCYAPGGPRDVLPWTTAIAAKFALDPERVGGLAMRLVTEEGAGGRGM